MNTKNNVIKLSKQKQNQMYRKILQSALMADPKTSIGQTVLEDAIHDYVHYATSRRGLDLTYSFDHYKSLQELTEEEQEELKNQDAPVNFGSYSNQNNHMSLNEIILQPQTLGDFAYYVCVIEHKLEQASINNIADFYSNRNPNGLRQEFCWQKESIKTLKEFIENDKIFSFADLVLINTYIKATYQLDDNEKTARHAGIMAASKFLKNAEKLAKAQNISTEKFLDAQTLIADMAKQEEEKNFQTAQIANETIFELHSLLLKITKQAIEQNNTKVLLALCKVQDVQQFFNRSVCAHLEEAAENLQNQEMLLALDNSKYRKASFSKIRRNLQTFLETNPNLLEARTLLYNVAYEDIKKMTPVSRRSETLTFEIEPVKPNQSLIEAKEIDVVLPLGQEAEIFVQKQKQKSTAPRPKTNRIIVAEDTHIAKPKTPNKKQEKIILANEIQSNTKLSDEGQVFVNKSLKTPYKKQEKIILANEIQSNTKLSDEGQVFVNKTLKSPNKKQEKIILANEIQSNTKLSDEGQVFVNKSLKTPYKKQEKIILANEIQSNTKLSDEGQVFVNKSLKTPHTKIEGIIEDDKRTVPNQAPIIDAEEDFSL